MAPGRPEGPWKPVAPVPPGVPGPPGEKKVHHILHDRILFIYDGILQYWDFI